MDAYRLGGGREVEKLILDQFSVFMYNEGRGKEITRTEYLKWKLRGKTRDEVSRLEVNHLHNRNRAVSMSVCIAYGSSIDE